LKTLHKYLTLQVLASMLLTMAVFTFVLLLGNVLKEILTLLVNSHARIGLVFEAIVLLIPWVWVFALPMGMITSTLLVFGRFSADQELTAARASGISLLSLITPVLLLSLFCCVLCAWFNMDLGPRSRVAYLGLRDEVLENLANIELPEGRFIPIGTNYIFYAEKNDRGKLQNVMVWYLDHNTTVEAPRGEEAFDKTNSQFVLNLDAPRIITMLTNGNPIITSFSSTTMPIPVNLNAMKNQRAKPAISDMTIWQLEDELQELQQRIPDDAPTNDVSKETKATEREARELPQNLIEQIRVAMNRQIAFSFGCFGFALIGIPLGIRVHRRETNIGVAIALGLVLIYYTFMLIADHLSSRPEFYPHLIVWIPNFLFQGVGAFLLWRANRGT
jgi:lipopolysaccharide export system permease protein